MEEEEMKKNIVILGMMCLLFGMLGCGQKEEVQQPVDTKVEVAVEQTVKGQEPEEEIIAEEETTEKAIVEEEQVEDPTANLSNEEWVKSLNLQTGTYLIFNDTTGERKVLEDGQEYTLLEGDQLAFWWPLDWKIKNRRTNLLYESELKYDCSFMYFNNDEIGERTELIIDVDDADGNRLSFTVYLSK